MRENILYIIVPCYNEQQVLPETSRLLLEKIKSLIWAGRISEKSRVVFVNDGSNDLTWQIIKKLHTASKYLCGIKLSKNFGHQNAVLAGLLAVKDKADMVISMDADLQDDINAVDAMVEKYHEGCEIVYAVRKGRKNDSFFKRFSAEVFYKVMKHLGANTIFNHADYRLMSKRAVEALAEFDEVNLFLRGIVPMLGFKSDFVYYERKERFAGESKYPLKKMIAFAFEGITSFSIRPIRMITLMGTLVFLASIAMLVYVLVSFFSGNAVAGWPSIVISVWGTGGLTLLSIGIVGEYIGKIYLESKKRPRFIIEEILD
ncbi:MAG: putative glycosyltransferase YkoT [Firmicutes bacterium ADurb.Bin300]|nr:MAG: putative glycosyltransferase YkoT [Firmicutes bacterium ADurb.Bin300]